MDLNNNDTKPEEVLRKDKLTHAHAETLQAIQSEVIAFKEAETKHLQTEALKQVDDDIATIRRKYREEHEAYVRTKRNDVRQALKQWKIRHCNARNLEFLCTEVNSDPVEAELDWLPSSHASSRASSRAPSVDK
ncbi:hypothetical protein H4582DRAFT_2080334 [Lactarius indigo]|nr:hypothetical protein H4582DRAFT_2080334 [Lactarius indigo]